MSRYWSYIKKHWYFFLFGPIFVILSAILEVTLPKITANLINNGIANGDISYIVKQSILMMVIALVTMVSSVLGAIFAINASTRFGANLRRDIFARVQKYSFANLDHLTTGSLITRITNDVTQMQAFVQNMLRMMLRAPTMMIGAMIMAFQLNLSLAMVLCVVIPVLMLSLILLIRGSLSRYSGMQAQLDLLNTQIGESIENERVIKSFAREDFEREKFYTVNDTLYKKSIHALKVMLWIAPICTIAINVATIATVWIAGRQIMIGNMELGTLTAFITYLSQILTQVRVMSIVFERWSRAKASANRIREIFDEELDLTDEESGDCKVEKGSIEFQNVSFRYFKNRREKVLNNISFRIEAGQTVGIIGSTGSGKTTLISMIPRLYDVDEGAVLVDGVDVKAYSFENLRKGIAVVLQKNMLFSGTVRENLYWGKEDANEEELDEASLHSQSSEFLSTFKDGYETELGHGGINLSGGQKQRLCIARALLRKPKILILDDSTSALDTATDAKFRKALREEASDITCLIIAQRISSVMDADRILVMDNGRIVGNGTHAELMRSCQVYREIYLTQKEGDAAND
ncbi:MAG: ABC transporter ATP-binding protein [Ruminococcaceae bacterium]|nr:ABC transporter ATP-binding protein [Oscillospiraceae bacterium]